MMNKLPNPITLFLKMLAALFSISFIGGAALLFWLGVEFTFWELFVGSWQGSVVSVMGVAVLYLGVWLLFNKT